MNFIAEYQLSDTTICDALLELFKQAHQKGFTKPGIVGFGTKENPEVKRSTDLYLPDADSLGSPTKFRFPEYHDNLTKFIDNYCIERKIYNYCGKFEMRYAPQIQWYKPDEGFYQWHIDGGHELCERALVFLTYLNDVEEGGTEFLNQNLTVKAVKGKTIIFPTGLTHIHRGQISKTQDKYILTGWLYWDNTK